MQHDNSFERAKANVPELLMRFGGDRIGSISLSNVHIDDAISFVEAAQTPVIPGKVLEFAPTKVRSTPEIMPTNIQSRAVNNLSVAQDSASFDPTPIAPVGPKANNVTSIHDYARLANDAAQTSAELFRQIQAQIGEKVA